LSNNSEHILYFQRQAKDCHKRHVELEKRLEQIDGWKSKRKKKEKKKEKEKHLCCLDSIGLSVLHLPNIA
jgi:hypothetical protein